MIRKLYIFFRNKCRRNLGERRYMDDYRQLQRFETPDRRLQFNRRDAFSPGRRIDDK